jgi:hypothetical protein
VEETYELVLYPLPPANPRPHEDHETGLLQQLLAGLELYNDPGAYIKEFSSYRHVAMDADAVLKRFNNYPQQQDEDVEIGEQGDGDSWPELRKIFNAAVADKARIKRLSQSLHSLQVNNKLLCTQNKELQHKLNVIKKRPTQQTILTTQDGNDWHGGAVFYSPRKLASERACKAAELNEAAQLQLKKNPHNREAKAAATAYKKRQQEEARVAQQRAAEERRQAKKAQAEALTTKRALKKQQREAATAQKSHNTLKKHKQKASHSAAKNPTKRHCVVAARSSVDAVPPAASPSPKCTKSGRNVRKPARFKQHNRSARLYIAIHQLFLQ